MAELSKPTRVVEGEVDLIECPVCHKAITARVVGEVRLGDLSIQSESYADKVLLMVAAPASTRVRQLFVDHACTAEDVANAEAERERAYTNIAVPLDPEFEGTPETETKAAVAKRNKAARPIADSPQA
jgi:hypothetical protein